LVTRARATPSAMLTAVEGTLDVAVTEIIGASGDVAVWTLSLRVFAETPAQTCASPRTATCAATRPYAVAKPSAAAGSDFSVGTTTTKLVAVYCGVPDIP
jgi:hypothetical protein